MSYAFDPELAHVVPLINDLPFTDIAAARAAEKEMTAHLPRVRAGPSGRRPRHPCPGA